ncbi:MAG: ribosomal-protein-alanine N-acetyltransferase [Ruminococcaceae bacterium]|nr:ribosomal-protein-alanine N-acetyltransferase [Oscillospiraceae bacterium]
MAEIKKLDESYISEIAGLEAVCFSDGWSEQMVRESFRYPGAEVFGIFSENKLVGYYVAGQILDEGELMSICVLPDYRGNGFGKMLMNHMDQIFIAKKASCVFLEVREGNTPARNLYKDSKFKEIGLRKGYYQDNGENAVIMIKNY